MAARLRQAECDDRNHVGTHAGLLTVGARLITRRLSTELIPPAGKARSRSSLRGIDEQIEEVGLKPTGAVYRRSRAPCSLHCHRQPFHDHSGLRATNRLTLDDCGAGAVRIHRRAALRNRTARLARLSAFVPAADGDHVAVQHHQRALALPGIGRPPVRQHDERRR